MDDDMAPVTAKAGHKPPEHVYLQALQSLEDADVPDDLKDIAENDWLLQLYLDRDHTTTIPTWLLDSHLNCNC